LQNYGRRTFKGKKTPTLATEGRNIAGQSASATVAL
jgi:hypothetical protein